MILFLVRFILILQQDSADLQARSTNMASVVSFDQSMSPYGLAPFVSVRLIVALAVFSFGIYRYSVSVKKYRVC